MQPEPSLPPDTDPIEEIMKDISLPGQEEVDLLLPAEKLAVKRESDGRHLYSSSDAEW